MAVVRSYQIDKKRLIRAPFLRYGGATGLITVIAAGTASAGHLYVLRNPDATKKVALTRLRISFVPTVAFGAAQAIIIAAYKMTAYSVAHTGGTAITPAKRRTSETNASVAAARIATTGALTAGTHTIAAQPIFSAGAHGTLPEFDSVWSPRDDHGEILEANEGLLIRNEVLMGASGVGQLIVEVSGYEI